MARHRDIRNLDIEDEYGYEDDVYGHSVEDDYYISPSHRQFIYNREQSRDSRSNNDDIIEEDEQEHSDLDAVRLESCIEAVTSTLGAKTIPRNELVNLINKYNYDVELILNHILENPKYQQQEKVPVVKDDFNILNLQKTQQSFNVPKLNFTKEDNTSTIDKEKRKFFIPKLNLCNSNENSQSPTKTIPNVGAVLQKTNDKSMINVPHSRDVNVTATSLTDLVSTHLSKQNNESPSKNKFIIPKLSTFGQKLELNEQTNADDCATLTDLVSNHFNKLAVDISSIGDNVVPELSKLRINDDNSHRTKSYEFKHDTNQFEIDLTKALRVTTSLPTFGAKRLDVKEDISFKIDFKDVSPPEPSKESSKVIKKYVGLKCALTCRDLLTLKHDLKKKKSGFGKVLCKEIGERRKVLFKIGYCVERYCKFRRKDSKIKVFRFDVPSGDDRIAKHLKK